MIPAAGDEHQIARKRTGVRARLAQQVRPHDGGERALRGGRADRVEPHQHDVLRRQLERRNALERAVDRVVGEVGRDQRVPRAAELPFAVTSTCREPGISSSWPATAAVNPALQNTRSWSTAGS
jgi:hypothetical protein